jgi:hypothetical protein
MKPNRFLTIVVLVVVLAIGMSVLLNSCASTPDDKETSQEAGGDAQPTAPTDRRAAAGAESAGSNVQASTSSVVAASGSGASAQSQTAADQGGDAGRDGITASFLQGLLGIFPRALSNMSWDRIGPIIGGLIGVAFFWGLAYRLARPARLRRAGSRKLRLEKPRAAAERSAIDRPASAAS